MADSKIDFSFENLHFSCKGDNAWVERQLNNVLSRIPALLSAHKKNDNLVEEVFEIKEEDLLTQEHEPSIALHTKKLAEKKPIVKKQPDPSIEQEKRQKQVKIAREKLEEQNRQQKIKEQEMIGNINSRPKMPLVVA